MRKVTLNMKENYKYEVIKKLVETNGNKKRASVKLGCTIRTINRLIKDYKKYGKEAFSHKNKGRSPSIKYPTGIKDKIISLYTDSYPDANIQHFSEIVFDEIGIKISPETIRRWLLEKDILSPKSHRKTKRRVRKNLRTKLKKAKSKKTSNVVKRQIEKVDKSLAHPRRERCKYFGEMIQMDASVFEWINGSKWHLHLAVDDATGTVVGAYFDTQETLNGYYNVFHQILTDYGIPAMFYTDRRTVFEYRRKARVFDNEDTYTQFAYACLKLGVEIKTTSVPQAKGRVERLNQSFQSRLPIELRRANVKSIEDANIFLNSYLKKYNQQFALQLNSTKSVFEPQPTLEMINNYLSIMNVRTIDHGHTIRFKNKVYMPARKNGKVICMHEGMKVIMVETFDKRLMMNIMDDLYYAKEIPVNASISQNFDYFEYDVPIIFGWTLPKKYSWRTDDFLGFLAKQKHRQDRNQNLC